MAAIGEDIWRGIMATTTLSAYRHARTPSPRVAASRRGIGIAARHGAAWRRDKSGEHRAGIQAIEGETILLVAA